MPLLTLCLTRERGLRVRTPDSQVVPNYLVDFFFYVPNAAQTHSQKKNQRSSFSSGILFHTSKVCECDKTAASVDQPALFMGDLNH